MPTLQGLPTEIAAMILAYLGQTDLVSMRETCKFYCAVAFNRFPAEVELSYQDEVQVYLLFRRLAAHSNLCAAIKKLIIRIDSAAIAQNGSAWAIPYADTTMIQAAVDDRHAYSSSAHGTVNEAMDKSLKAWRAAILGIGDLWGLFAYIVSSIPTLTSLELEAPGPQQRFTTLQLLNILAHACRARQKFPFRSIEVLKIWPELDDDVVELWVGVQDIFVMEANEDFRFETPDFAPGVSTRIRNISVENCFGGTSNVIHLVRQGRLVELAQLRLVHSAYNIRTSFNNATEVINLLEELAGRCTKLRLLVLDFAYQSAEDDDEVLPFPIFRFQSLPPTLTCLKVHVDLLKVRNTHEFLERTLSSLPEKTEKLEITGASFPMS
jgi:hypothetical protein